MTVLAEERNAFPSSRISPKAIPKASLEVREEGFFLYARVEQQDFRRCAASSFCVKAENASSN